MSLNSYKYLSVPAAKGKPLLFLFHGTGGDEGQLVSLGQKLIPGAGIISPLGDVSEHGAARFFRRTAEGVYDMDDLARATAKMAEFVSAHVDEVQPSIVLGAGYSNGANILASITFAKPALFDAAILMHPLIPFEPDIKGVLHTSYLITAGQRDPICPAPMTEQLKHYLLNAGAHTDIFWHEGGHELRPQEVTASQQFLDAYVKKAGEDHDRD